MPTCSVNGCISVKKSNKDKHLTYHRLPTDSKLKAKWIKAIGLGNLPASSKICSYHFGRNEFLFNSNGKSYLKLKCMAVPSMYMRGCVNDDEDNEETSTQNKDLSDSSPEIPRKRSRRTKSQRRTTFEAKTPPPTIAKPSKRSASKMRKESELVSTRKVPPNPKVSPSNDSGSACSNLSRSSSNESPPPTSNAKPPSRSAAKRYKESGAESPTARKVDDPPEISPLNPSNVVGGRPNFNLSRLSPSLNVSPISTVLPTKSRMPPPQFHDPPQSIVSSKSGVPPESNGFPKSNVSSVLPNNNMSRISNVRPVPRQSIVPHISYGLPHSTSCTPSISNGSPRSNLHPISTVPFEGERTFTVLESQLTQLFSYCFKCGSEIKRESVKESPSYSGEEEAPPGIRISFTCTRGGCGEVSWDSLKPPDIEELCLDLNPQTISIETYRNLNKEFGPPTPRVESCKKKSSNSPEYLGTYSAFSLTDVRNDEVMEIMLNEDAPQDFNTGPIDVIKIN